MGDHALAPIRYIGFSRRIPHTHATRAAIVQAIAVLREALQST
jgi:hypothetical protein